MTTSLAEVEPAPRPDTLNPMSMLQAALERGIDPDALKKMMDLAERWQTQEAKKLFDDAMNKCQIAMPCIVRDRKNNQTNSTYASLETIQTWAKPVYTQHGFSLTFGQDKAEKPDEIRIVCSVSHTGGYTHREHLDGPSDTTGPKGAPTKTGIQGAGSTWSYLRRNLICMIFNIVVADTDVDGQNQDALNAITDEEALQVEDLITDSKANREKFLQWLADGNHFVGTERLVTRIKAKSLAHVIDTLNRRKAGVK